jgi:hypothetical protein
MSNDNETLNFMIDIETLGLENDAVIVEIAMIPFTKNVILMDFAYQSYIDWSVQLFRSISSSALKWWLNQDRELMEKTLKPENHTTLNYALNMLRAKTYRCYDAFRLDNPSLEQIFWSKPPSFDLKILEHAYKNTTENPPWCQQKTMDVRTLEIIPEIKNLKRTEQKHSAFGDALFQIRQVQEFYKMIGV